MHPDCEAGIPRAGRWGTRQVDGAEGAGQGGDRRHGARVPVQLQGLGAARGGRNCLSEFALAHVEGSRTVAAYARDDLLEKRRPVMQGVERVRHAGWLLRWLKVGWLGPSLVDVDQTSSRSVPRSSAALALIGVSLYCNRVKRKGNAETGSVRSKQDDPAWATPARKDGVLQ